MKKKEFLTEAKRKAIISDKEKAILESFAKTFNKIKRIDENEINEFEEENPVYSRMQQNDMNYEKEYLNSEDENTYKVEVIIRDSKYRGSKNRWVYEITANSEEEAEAKAVDKFNEELDINKIDKVYNYLFSAKVISNPTDNDVVQGRSVKLSEELDNNDEGEDIQLYPFSSEFVDIINGVAKTKNDLKYSAGATFGGASENYYSRLSIALNDFYKNIYKPIEAKYIEEMAQEDKSRRRLYPQNYENK